METIPRSTQCVQQHLSPASPYFTAEELSASAQPGPRRAAPTSRQLPTSCETCDEVTADLFGVDGSALCADCTAEIGGELMRPAQELHFAGDQSLLDLPCVAVVGSRDASELGIRRARRLARELAEAGVVVVSGLARGVDAAAHREAMACGGRTIGVVGTPLDRAYPAAHAKLQERIAADHLLVSPFSAGWPLQRKNFPIRNRLMAAICDATVIVEAGEASGTRHQAEECRRLARDLYLCSSLVANMAVRWTLRFLGPGTHVLVETEQILRRLPVRAA